MSDLDMTARVRALAGNSTADLIGLAAGEHFSADELGDLGEQFGPVQSVIVLALHITDPALTVRYRWTAEYADSPVSASLGDALLRDSCWRLVRMLEASGYRAAIPRNLRYADDSPRHRLSYKKAGVLAGLGAFGKNQLLIHPEWGPWLFLRTVITDAPLTPDAPLALSPCEDCGLCLPACPAGALSEAGFSRESCEGQQGFRDGPWTIRLSPEGQIPCEQCLRACPVGVAPPRMQL